MGSQRDSVFAESLFLLLGGVFLKKILKKTFKWLSFLISFVLMAYSLLMIFVCKINILNLGLFAIILLAVLFFILSFCQNKIIGFISKNKKSKLFKTGTAILTAVVLMIISLISVETVCMKKACKSEPKSNSTVIVLGCRVKNGKPSLMLKGRLDAAYNYLEKNPDSICIVSGGKGADESISEAECMHKYLVDKGIDEKRLIKEDKSKTTYENFEFSAQIIEEKSLSNSVAIATNDYHEYRASIFAKKFSLDFGSVPSKTAYYLYPVNYVRELFGILYFWIK